MSKCTDPETGLFLGAYELGILPDADLERFEVHLMACDHCLDQVREFAPSARSLREDAAVRRTVAGIVREQAAGAGGDPSPASGEDPGLWRRLWPATAPLLKPGLSWLVAVVLLVPAVIGLEHIMKPDSRPGIRPLQAIHLMPVRTAGDNVLDSASGLDAVISFGVTGAAPGTAYDVAVTDEAGGLIVHRKAFDAFDATGVGRLLVPAASMNPGTYHLVVRKPGAPSQPPLHDYRFRIR